MRALSLLLGVAVALPGPAAATVGSGPPVVVAAPAVAFEAASASELPAWVPGTIDQIEGFEVAAVAAFDDPGPQDGGLPQLTPEQQRRRQERIRAERETERAAQRAAEREVDPSRSTFEFALPEERGGGTVTGNATAIDAAAGQQVLLSGGVSLAYQDIYIEAERIELDLENQRLTASGEVIFDQGPRRLTGDTAIFHLDDKTATLTNATAFVEPDYYFSGAELQKVGDDRYTVVDGVFTSCSDEVPDWSFKVRRAQVDVGGYARIHGASFRVKKAPLLYFPYLLWPAKLDRASGFLVAQPGYSRRRGAALSTAYFQTLGRSADTTIFTDLYSQGFIGIGDEFRYRPSEGTKGIFEGYAIRDPDDDRWRWKVNLEHVTEDLPLGLRGVIDFNDYSDFRYFEEFERDFDRTTLRQIHSQGFVSGNWGTHSLNLEIDSQETLIVLDDPATEADEEVSVTLRSLPEAEYRLRSTQLGSLPLYLEADVSLAQLQVDRGGAYDGSYGRIDLEPSLELPIKTWPWLSMSLTGGVRYTWWGDSLCNSAVDALGQPIGDGERCEEGVRRFTGEAFDRAAPLFQADVFGPSFSRIYEKEIGDFGKFKHVIGPRITYNFLDVEDANQSRAPLYDERDGLGSNNSVRVALINKVLGKPKPKPVEKSAEEGDEDDEQKPVEETAGTLPGTEQAAIEPNLGTGDAEVADDLKLSATDVEGETLAEGAVVAEGDSASDDPNAPVLRPTVGGSSREVLFFELEQSYSFDDTQPLQRSTERNDQAGPISALVRFNPTDGTSLKAEVFYSTLFSRVSATTLSGSYLLPGKNTVGLTYVNRVRPIDGMTESDQIRLWTGINLIPKKLKLDAQLNYDIDNSILQQQRYVLRYTSACYGVQFEFRDARFGLQREQDYRLAITLKNVGTFLDLSGRNTGSGF